MGGHKIVNQNKLHYLTLTVVGWLDIFTRKEYKDIIINSLKYCQTEKGLIIFAYVVMSNHLHLIVRTDNENGLSGILRDFKGYTSKSIIKSIEDSQYESRKGWMLRLFKYYAKYNSNNTTYQFWQQKNHPVELQSPKWIQQKLNYIHLNPVRSGIVSEPEHYIYCSASNYVNNTGILEVEILDLGLNIGYVHLG